MMLQAFHHEIQLSIEGLESAFWRWHQADDLVVLESGSLFDPLRLAEVACRRFRHPQSCTSWGGRRLDGEPQHSVLVVMLPLQLRHRVIDRVMPHEGCQAI